MSGMPPLPSSATAPSALATLHAPLTAGQAVDASSAEVTFIDATLAEHFIAIPSPASVPVFSAGATMTGAPHGWHLTPGDVVSWCVERSRYTLGRAEGGAGHICIGGGAHASDKEDSISRTHAQITFSGTTCTLKNVSTVNPLGMTHVERAGHRSDRELRPSQEIPLESGDVIVFAPGFSYLFIHQDGVARLVRYRGELSALTPILIRTMKDKCCIPPGPDVAALAFEAWRSTEEVEIFLKTPLFTQNNNIKEKHVGTIITMTRENEHMIVTCRINGHMLTIKLSDILMIRPRAKTEELNQRYIHPHNTNPQFKDRSINVSGTDGRGMVVLVDFTDARLVWFLEHFIQPVRHRFETNQISELQAGREIWQIVRSYVPYHNERLWAGIENRLYLLGEFIERGVCNERGMLLQIACQYAGVFSWLMKGNVVGQGRHAWVKQILRRGELVQGAAEVLLDPQSSTTRAYILQNLGLVEDQHTPYAQDHLGTVMGINFVRQPISDGTLGAHFARRYRAFAAPDYGPLHAKLILRIRERCEADNITTGFEGLPPEPLIREVIDTALGKLRHHGYHPIADVLEEDERVYRASHP